MKIDLQIHTTASDGELTPTQIVRRFQRCGFVAIAICDHDSVAGLPEAWRAGKKYGITVVPGIELSTELDGYSLHLLGLGINHRLSALRQRCRRFHAARAQRARRVVAKLKTLGFHITNHDVKQHAESTVTRGHISAALMADARNLPSLKKYCPEKLTVSNIVKALITPGKPAYVPYKKDSVRSDIKLIHRAGGLAILSHPGLLDIDHPGLNTKRLIVQLKQMGMDGLESVSGPQSARLNKKYLRLARQLNLIVSAGSDFHGCWYQQTLGSFRAPKWIWDELKIRFNAKRKMQNAKL